MATSATSIDRAAAVTLDRLGLRVAPGRLEDRPELLDFLLREFGAEWWHETTWFLDEGGDIGDFQLLRDGDRQVVGMARCIRRRHDRSVRRTSGPSAGRRTPVASDRSGLRRRTVVMVSGSRS